MFASTLLRWYEENGRDLPWRHTRDPYTIWLSEVILQQTRIEQGRDYWLRFVRRWPRVEDLARATEDEVLREWQGLGYYTRARNLLKTAQAVAAKGRFPQTYDALLELKGVGPYTAAAIASLAFDEDVAVVDGNVYRVLARHYGIFTPMNSTEGVKEFHLLANHLLPKGQSAQFNQAIMDFGAIQCTPQSPRCLNCPLQESCDALRTGRIDALPVKLRKTEVKTRRLSYVYIRCNGYTAIRRRPAGDIWQGLWEPYNQTEQAAPADLIPSPADTELVLLRQNVKHVLTHRILLADFYLWMTDRRPSLPEEYIWVRESDLDRYAKPRLVELLLESLPG
jgi:A/G-specific adenine glycosylase